MQYRPEVDGLRAIAVIPVLLFHAGFSLFSGGFVGVDIFFVISGYLITTILLSELASGRYSIVNFYERRARRILPALFAMLAVTSVFAFLLLPSVQLESFLKSLQATLFFLSNVFFFQEAGYFALASEEQPLLHTWSLAVEEQYYLFFPILLAACWRFGRSSIALLITALLVASFLLCIELGSRGQVNANFYLIFTRAWELFAGSLVAMLLLYRGEIFAARHWLLREAAVLTGLLMLAYSITSLSRYDLWPGPLTLLPVVGSCLIILFGSHSQVAQKLLAHKWPVFIGLLSYSLYLWHQPVLAFLRLRHIGEPNHLQMTVALGLSFALAWLSYRFVEQPFRNRQRFDRRRIFVWSGWSSGAALVLVSALLLVEPIGARKSIAFDDVGGYSPLREQCHTNGEDYLSPEQACTYFGSKVSWASLGDSHVVEPAYALAEALEPMDVGLLHLSFSTCPPALLFDTEIAGCASWYREALQRVIEDQDIENVLLGFRYTSFLFGDQRASYPDLPNKLKKRIYDLKGNELPKRQARALYWRSLKVSIEMLRAAGKEVYLLYPVPELPAHIGKLATPLTVFSDQTLMPLDTASSRSYYEQRNAYILERFASLEQQTGLHPVRPAQVLCEGQYCDTVVDGIAQYYDDNHLSIAGARRLLSDERLANALLAESRRAGMAEQLALRD